MTDVLDNIKGMLNERLADQKELFKRSKKKISAIDSYQSGQWDAQENCWEDEIEFLVRVLENIEKS